jgi:acetyl esterase/lipase
VFALIGTTLSQSGQAQVFEKTTVAYREIDGHPILVDVYRPPGNEIRPVIVFIHGGALILGNREQSVPEVLTLAQERRYAFVSIDYRLAPETKLPGIVSDVEAAFQWLASDAAKRFHLDIERMIVAGGSAGGYLTLLTGYRVSPKPKALVALWPYGELNADWYAKPSPHPMHNQMRVTREQAMKQTDGTVISDYLQRKGETGKYEGAAIYVYYRQNGLWPQEVSGFSAGSLAEDIAPYEPVRHITRDYPPTLLIHGTEDTDVPYQESVKMAEQFERHGVPFILRPVERAEHGLAGGDPEKIREAYQTMRQFVMRYLEPEGSE